MTSHPPQDKYASEGKLGENGYNLIDSPNRLLGFVIIHEAHIILKRICNGIQGFRGCTLGPVLQFEIMS